MRSSTRHYKVRLTLKQNTALNLLKADPTITPTEAMRKAGYAESSLQTPGRTLLGSRAVLHAQDKWLEVLTRHGISMETLAVKYSDLLHAKRLTRYGEQDDNSVQFKTAEILKKDLGIGSESRKEEESITWKWKRPGV